eukprot:m.347927 g.347927  ORF g.347927 m.347927 type:complete len:307 (+) comp34932_c0_seq1:14-934(+)
MTVLEKVEEAIRALQKPRKGVSRQAIKAHLESKGISTARLAATLKRAVADGKLEQSGQSFKILKQSKGPPRINKKDAAMTDEDWFQLHGNKLIKAMTKDGKTAEKAFVKEAQVWAASGRPLGTGLSVDDCEYNLPFGSALEYACAFCGSFQIKTLLDLGFPAENLNDNPCSLSALGHAIERWHSKEIITLLHEKGGHLDNVGDIDDGNDPCPISSVGMAVRNRDLDQIKHVLALGADVNAPKHCPPLIYLIQKKHGLNDNKTYLNFRDKPILEFLLKQGASFEVAKESGYYRDDEVFPKAREILEH